MNIDDDGWKLRVDDGPRRGEDASNVEIEGGPGRKDDGCVVGIDGGLVSDADDDTGGTRDGRRRDDGGCVMGIDGGLGNSADDDPGGARDSADVLGAVVDPKIDCVGREMVGPTKAGTEGARSELKSPLFEEGVEV